MAALERYGDERIAVIYDVANGHVHRRGLAPGAAPRAGPAEARAPVGHAARGLSAQRRRRGRGAVRRDPAGARARSVTPICRCSRSSRPIPIRRSAPASSAWRHSAGRAAPQARSAAPPCSANPRRTCMLPESVDVVVVGAGNAAMCAALAAAEQGASVLVLERAPEEERGGNTRFTAGAIRFAYDGVDDLRALMPDLTDDEIAQTDFGTYTEDQFFDDMARVTEYRTDPDLAELLVRRSHATMMLDARQGHALRADLRAPGVQGRRPLQVLGRAHGRGLGRRPGPGRGAARRPRGRNGIQVVYERARAVAARRRRRRPRRARALRGQDTHDARPRRWCWPAAASRPMPSGARAISARAGTSPRCAARASTPATASAWRSTSAPCPAATGRAATRSAGTATRPTSATSRSATASRSTRYPFGIMVNANGERFVDEGADFRNYTYAKYGRVILAPAATSSPGRSSTRRSMHLLRDEYRIRQVTKVTADTLEELVPQARGRERRARPGDDPGVTTPRCAPTCRSIPNVKDGRGTRGLDDPEVELGQPARHAAVRGLRGDLRHHLHLRRPAHHHRAARWSTPTARRCPGLYAAGELVGGLFYFNYPGGTGLMSGAVFGRIAGTSAGHAASGTR